MKAHNLDLLNFSSNSITMDGQEITDLASLKETTNWIINGEFNVWQRGTSLNVASTPQYTADRFKYIEGTTSVSTIEQSTDVPSNVESDVQSSFSLLRTCNNTVSIVTVAHAGIQTSIEGYNYASLVEKECTLSFWVKSSKTGTYCVAFNNFTTASTRRSYIVDYTIDTANTWEKKTITLTLDSDSANWNYTNDAGLYISWLWHCGPSYTTSTTGAWQDGFYLASDNIDNNSSTNYTFYLTQVQFEIGASPSPFAKRSISIETTMCKRYYEDLCPVGSQNIYAHQVNNYTTAPYVAINLIYATEKRATPTITISKQGQWAGYSIVEYSDVSGYTRMEPCSDYNNPAYITAFKADAELP